MADLLSESQVLALAPDASAQSAGRGLAAPKHWRSHGLDATAIWGECQGSALYQVRFARDDGRVSAVHFSEHPTGENT